MLGVESVPDTEAPLRKHYLLFAHDQPDHVLRLVDRLDDGEASFWLHLDARTDTSGWSDVLAVESLVLVEPRVPIVWGTWSQVEAMIAMVRACLAGGVPGYLMMISGQSYPVKSTGHIDAYVEAHRDLLHMDLWQLPDRWPHNYQNRLIYFCIPLSQAKGDLGLLRRRQDMNARELFGWTRRLVRSLGPRRALSTLRLIGTERPDIADRVMGGSTWLAMPWDVAADVMRYHDDHPEYAEFLQWSMFADEQFFQTLLVEMDPQIRERVAPTMTHVDWTEGDWDLPRRMGLEDLSTLLSQPPHVLFARKFLAPASDDLADALDEALRTAERP